MDKQFWAAGATMNCVWLFQTMEKIRVGAVFGKYWETRSVFLTPGEAWDYGRSKPYAWGKVYMMNIHGKKRRV